MKQHISIIRMMLVVTLLVGLFVVVGVASSQSPETAGTDAALAPAAPTSLLFSYQGQLLDTNGDPITDPAVDMVFKLYDVAELGTACWTEDHTGAEAVDVEDGLFNVLLGQITPMDTACLTGDVYLELVVGSEIMSPRELLTTVFHATEASALSDGATARGDLTIDGNLAIDGSGQSIFINNQDVDDSGTATLRFGNGENWLGIDNNEIVSYGDELYLQTSASGATAPVIIGTNLTVEGQVKAGYNQATTSYFGKSAIGYGGLTEDWARFGHLDKDADSGGYAMMQDAVGRTLVNAAEGQPIEFRINNISRVKLDADGKVGIGTTAPSKRLDVAGAVRVGEKLYLGGTDFIMEEYAGRGGGRALVNDNDDILTINYDTDFSGGVRINGPVHCGALVETNLQTTEEQKSGRIDRFEEGDVLCWSAETGQLELCTTDSNRLVMAVADANGKPIVMGAEPIKVLDPVVAGDILVSSDIPGYTKVNNDPKPGTVIAQALEDFSGEQGVIKAMIRKW